MAAGYSGKPLVEKLGVKPDSTLVLIGAGWRQNMPPWMAWPGSQRSSGVKTDLTEDVIRDIALAAGMVDTKVCAFDETWSGLRLTLRRS